MHKVPHWERYLALVLDSSFLPMQTLGGSRKGSNKIKNELLTPGGSSAWPSLASGYLGLNQQIGPFSLPLSLPFKCTHIFLSTSFPWGKNRL